MKILIVGLGKAAWGYASSNVMLRGITHTYSIRTICPDATLIGVDPSEFARTAWSNEFHSTAVSSLEDIKDLNEFNLVVICTPAHALIEQLDWILSRSAHSRVLVEKPLAMSFDHIANLQDYSKNWKERVLVNFPRLFQPETQTLREIIQDSFSEVPISISGEFSGGFFNTGSHFISLLNYLFGNLDFELSTESGGNGLNIAGNPSSYRFQINGKMNFQDSGESTGNLRITGPVQRINYDQGGALISCQINGDLFNLETTRSRYQLEVYKSIFESNTEQILHPSRLDCVLPALRKMVTIGVQANAAR